jgi:hypothetical protein
MRQIAGAVAQLEKARHRQLRTVQINTRRMLRAFDRGKTAVCCS